MSGHVPDIAVLRRRADGIIARCGSGQMRAILAGLVAAKNAETPIDPETDTQQLISECQQIIDQADSDALAILTREMASFLIAAGGIPEFVSVLNIAARDAIPNDLRTWGMWVYTFDTGKVWVLQSNLSTWVEKIFGGGTPQFLAVPTNDERNAIPTGDRTIGMWVYTTVTDKVWVLQSDLTTWVEKQIGPDPAVYAPFAWMFDADGNKTVEDIVNAHPVTMRYPWALGKLPLDDFSGTKYLYLAFANSDESSPTTWDFPETITVNGVRLAVSKDWADGLGSAFPLWGMNFAQDTVGTINWVAVRSSFPVEFSEEALIKFA